MKNYGSKTFQTETFIHKMALLIKKLLKLKKASGNF